MYLKRFSGGRNCDSKDLIVLQGREMEDRTGESQEIYFLKIFYPGLGSNFKVLSLGQKFLDMYVCFLTQVHIFIR